MRCALLVTAGAGFVSDGSHGGMLFLPCLRGSFMLSNLLIPMS